MGFSNGIVHCGGSDTDITEQHFTGKMRDAETGDDDFGARYYSSMMGRFLSPDWSAKIEPVPYVKLDDPQSLNLYSYVEDNPIGSTDPTGHYICNGNQCKMVKKALKAVNKASKSNNLTAEERTALKTIAAFTERLEKTMV